MSSPNLDFDLPPDTTPYMAAWIVQLDAQARVLGQRMREIHDPAELRALAVVHAERELSWLAGFNLDLAENLERDPRLAAIHVMWAAAVGDGGERRFFLTQYQRCLTDHLERGAKA